MLNSSVAQQYPELVEEVVRLGWGVVAHGRDNSTLNATLAEADEREYVAEATERIEVAVGSKPTGSA